MEIAHKLLSYGTIEKDGQRYTKDGYFFIIRTEDSVHYTEYEYCIHPDGTFLYSLRMTMPLISRRGHLTANAMMISSFRLSASETIGYPN